MSGTAGGKPRGRRPGPESSRSTIVAAARHEFARRGFDRATLRSIAARAGVDPATIYRFFADKNELLAAAIEFPVSDDTVAAVFGDTANRSPADIVEQLLQLWSDPDVAERVAALLRVAATHPDAGQVVGGLIDDTVVRNLVAGVDDDTAEFRAALVASQLAGLALLRLVIPLPALAQASVDDLVAAIAPTIERYLDGDVHSVRRG
jgi:AcrR family transcriptional regulator